MYYVRYKRKKNRRVKRVFFLLFALACIGLSFALAFGFGKGANFKLISRPTAAGQALPLLTIQRQERLLLHLNVPIDEGDSWRVRDNKLELTLLHNEAIAAFPLEEQYLEQQISFRREEGKVILVIELDNLPPIFSLRTTAQGYTFQWLEAGLAGKRIAIDPGHGGHDPGAVGHHLDLYEKNVTLAIALELKAMLEQAGAEVFMTRTTDIGSNYWTRHDLVNEYSPDFFLSIHNNSWSDKNARGLETYYNPMSLNGYHSKAAAKLVQNKLVAELQRYNRGIKYKKKSDAVLQVDAPAVLAEILFISNKEEEAMLAAPNLANRAAAALFKGIAAFFLDPRGE